MLVAVAICSVLAPAAQADVKRVHLPAGFVIVDNVNVRNGNFSLTFSSDDTGTGVPYQRTYNSKAVNRGVFGLGWGSPFDTRLTVMADGTIAVRENGNGARTVYGQASANAVAAGASEIAATVRSLNSKAYRPDLAKRLTESFQLRLDTIDKYGIKFDQPSGSLPIDRRTTFVGGEDDCDDARVQNAFRVHCDGGRDMFNRRGGLEFFDQAGRTVKLDWEGALIQKVYTDRAHFLNFTYAPRKLTVTDEAGHAAVYEFDLRGRNTAYTSNQNGRVTFAYDERSNLTRVGFVDTTSIAITYNKDDQATSVKDRKGRVTTFEYRDTPGGYETVVRKPNADGVVDTVIYVMTK